MNEVLKDKLRVIASDEFMLVALKAVVTDKIENNKLKIDEVNDDNILGQKYRATEKAKKIMGEVLDEISSYKNNKFKNNLIHKER